MIKVQNLSQAFPKRDGSMFYAVKDLSFEANDGEIVCLLGVNGAGKTTAMRVLSTVLKATSGMAEIQGWDIAKNPGEVRKNLGFLSGDTGLYNRLRAHEFIR